MLLTIPTADPPATTSNAGKKIVAVLNLVVLQVREVRERNGKRKR
jgi:hypothetical protein